MNIAYDCCPFRYLDGTVCHGDIYLDYKGGHVWKCIQGSHYFLASDQNTRIRLLRREELEAQIRYLDLIRVLCEGYQLELDLELEEIILAI